MLSVSAETAVYSQQATLRARSTTDQASAAPTGFSSLVDSNTDAATATRDDSSRQPSDQPAPSPRDDTNSAPTNDAASADGKTPPRGATKTTSNSDGSGKTATDATGQQQPVDASTAADASTTTDASTAAAQVIATDAAAQGVPAQGGGKDKATTKSDTTQDDLTVDTAPVDQATTLVVAVVAAIAGPNPTTPVTPTSDASQAAVAATAAASSAPGAIAAAAASKVAADVAKATVTDQAQGVVPPQQSVSQTLDPLSAQRVSTATPDVQDDGALLTQVATTGQTPVFKADVPSAPTVKIAKTASTTASAGINVSNIEPPATADAQAAKVTAADETKTIDPIAPKKPVGATPAHDTADEALAKAQPDADAPAVPTVHQHAAAKTEIAQPNALNAPDLASTTAAQSAANPAVTTMPAPAPATVLDTSNLTIMTGQAVPLSGLAVEISANAKAGNSRFEIRLDPPDLGRIDVRLDVDKNGQVTSRLFVEKSETLDLLRRDAPQLQQALQDAGLKTSDSGLQFSLRDQNPQQGQGNADGNGNGQNSQRLVIVEDETAAAGAAGRSYGRSLSASGGVDIRV